MFQLLLFFSYVNLDKALNLTRALNFHSITIWQPDLLTLENVPLLMTE